MCLICSEFQKERMNIKEARRALGEMTDSMDRKHRREVEEMLEEAADKRQEDQDDDT